MPCISVGNAIICHSAGGFRLRLNDGRYVFMDWHRYLGPTFFFDRMGKRLIEEWWEDEQICDALEWFQSRGFRA